MIEKVFNFTTSSQEKKIEKVTGDENAHINHMLLVKDSGLPIHFSNANVYMLVVRGMVSIALDEQEVHEYEAGTILNIPEGTKMNVQNLHDDMLELFVIKAPAPKA